MRILVCGSRDWSDGLAIAKVLDECELRYGDFHLIHGNARGADKIAGQYASDSMSMITTAVPAKWGQGKGAGFERNSYMLEKGKPNLVIAFQKDNSRGTQDTINKAEKLGIPTIVIKNREDANRVIEHFEHARE